MLHSTDMSISIPWCKKDPSVSRSLETEIRKWQSETWCSVPPTTDKKNYLFCSFMHVIEPQMPNSEFYNMKRDSSSPVQSKEWTKATVSKNPAWTWPQNSSKLGFQWLLSDLCIFWWWSLSMYTCKCTWVATKQKKKNHLNISSANK